MALKIYLKCVKNKKKNTVCFSRIKQLKRGFGVHLIARCNKKSAENRKKHYPCFTIKKKKNLIEIYLSQL
jgi:hypothetical protein